MISCGGSPAVADGSFAVLPKETTFKVRPGVTTNREAGASISGSSRLGQNRPVAAAALRWLSVCFTPVSKNLRMLEGGPAEAEILPPSWIPDASVMVKVAVLFAEVAEIKGKEETC